MYPAELPPGGRRRHGLRDDADPQAARAVARAGHRSSSGLSNLGVISHNEGGGVHTRAHAGWLSGVLPKRTEGADITAGKTIDQYAADKLGADTPLRSLELTTESNFQVGNCENGYSCAYLNSTSWRDAEHAAAARARSARRLPAAVRRRRQRAGAAGADAEGPQHPRLGDRQHARGSRSGSASAIAGWWATTSTRSATSSGGSSGPRRTTTTTPLPIVEQPAGVPEEYDEHAKLLMDLLVLGLSGRHHARQLHADRPRVERPDLSGDRRAGRRTTRCRTIRATRTTSSRTRRSTPTTCRCSRDCSRRCAARRTATARCSITRMLVYGAGMGDGDQHTPLDLPVVLAGGGCGQLKGGRHLKYDDEHAVHEPRADRCSTRSASTSTTIGDSTGRLTDL